MDIMNSVCKCGSNKKYLECCGEYINGNKVPQTPEQLMRSRYTAYATYSIDYIAKTMCGNASEGFDIKSAKLSAKEIIWTKLEVLHSELDNENKGFVEFKAYYSEQNTNYMLHEKSEFHRKNGVWFYVNGIIFR